MDSNENQVDHQTPCVAVFFLYGDRLLVDGTPVEHAEVYGDTLTAPTAHVDYWTTLQEQRVVDPLVEYDEVPRGRVSFLRKTDPYVIYIDRCILKPSIVNRISTILRLPRDRVIVATDGHYKCPGCLNRRPGTRRMS